MQAVAVTENAYFFYFSYLHTGFLLFKGRNHEKLIDCFIMNEPWVCKNRVKQTVSSTVFHLDYKYVLVSLFYFIEHIVVTQTQLHQNTSSSFMNINLHNYKKSWDFHGLLHAYMEQIQGKVRQIMHKTFDPGWWFLHNFLESL